jgi:hypothetical protein
VFLVEVREVEEAEEVKEVREVDEYMPKVFYLNILNW